MINQILPIPSFFDENKADSIYQISYAQRAKEAREWAQRFKIQPSELDNHKICMVIIDQLNAFCLSNGELFVNGAVEDSIRICEYIYKNIANISQFFITLESHPYICISSEIFWVNQSTHPSIGTIITSEDIKNGVWKVNPHIAKILNKEYLKLSEYALNYTMELEQNNKKQLIIWNYHGNITSNSNAIVSIVEEAVFFHSMARDTMPYIIQKSNNSLAESYSPLGAEVRNSFNRATKNIDAIRKLSSFDKVIVVGEAKSHCVMEFLLDIIEETRGTDFIKNLFILEDCMSSVVLPEIDFTDQTKQQFEKFTEMGIHLISSKTPVHELG